ncbi:hypothetical protein [Aridibaculum aurantiacum]|uniref:hypothetical protein n=1 Tax=Aridibaculum aurantiacum TaxID=2810307 RepID=UPI001A9755CE|nr:hypothetical protein [Aridibaculum aurantiacum]
MSKLLHDAISDVLVTYAKPLSTREITQIIKEKKLWVRPKDGKHPAQSQINARVNNYGHLFTLEDGLVRLNNDQVIDSFRIARLCWNNKGWQLPSGRTGKSTHKDSHEAVHGYGHEEWLFDISKTVGGYHYAFLEPVRKQQQAYEGKAFSVWLYSVDGNSKLRYFNGIIHNLIAIGEDEANEVTEIYEANGWLAEMKDQLGLVEIEDFSGFKGVNMFNVKFKPEDMDYQDYIELDPEHSAYRINRYSFAHYDESFAISEQKQEFSFDAASTQKHAPTKTAVAISRFWRKPQAIEIELHHQLLSTKLLEYLRKEHGNKNVVGEHKVNGNSRIDIVVKKGSGYTFYEIKTYADVRVSIREAIGQIMEYCFYTKANRADELIIVTPKPARTEDAIAYMCHLRQVTKLNLYYQYFDLSTNTLSDQF